MQKEAQRVQGITMKEEDIWKEMEDDLRKKYAQVAPHTLQEKASIMKVYAMEDTNPFEVEFMFVKYVIKHYIKKVRNRHANR